MSGKRILMLVGDYVEDYEVMVPFQALQMVGHTVHAVCPDKVAGDIVRTAVHDFEGDQTYSEKRGHNFTLNATFAEIDPVTYDALVVPGVVPQSICASIHGSWKSPSTSARPKTDCSYLSRPPTVGGSRRSCGQNLYGLSGLWPEVVSAGGNFTSVAVDAVVVDGNLVTAPAWPAHPQWLAAFLEILGTTISHRPLAAV